MSNNVSDEQTDAQTSAQASARPAPNYKPESSGLSCVLTRTTNFTGRCNLSAAVCPLQRLPAGVPIQGVEQVLRQ